MIINKIYRNMSSNKKYFIYYCRISVSEGLKTELSTSDIMLEKYNKEVYQKCRYCHCVIEIEKAFKEEEDTCNKCLELLKNEDRINPRIKSILSGQKIKSIGFLQTFIVHL